MINEKKFRIGDIIDSRPDGSYLYMSYRGVLNLDNWRDLVEAQDEDEVFLNAVEETFKQW